MRLYRGLKTPYKSELVGTRESFPSGTDFSDCPYTALQYARGHRGELIVLDVSEEASTLCEHALRDRGALARTRLGLGG